MKRIWIPEAPFVLRGGRTAEIETPPLPIGLEGFFEIELIPVRPGIRGGIWRFKNLITDAGVNAMAGNTPMSLTNYCGVGSGTTAPAVGNTALVSQIGVRTASNGGFADDENVYTGNEYLFLKRTRVFSTSEANGNLSEVGMFQLASGGTMFCRQLIRDVSNNPTTITKTSDYELRVTYEIRYYPTIIASTYSATILGSSQTITYRAAWAHATTFWGLNQSPLNMGLGTSDYQLSNSNTLPAYNASGLNGTTYNSTLVTAATYVAGTFQRDYTIEWGAAVANSDNIYVFKGGLYGCPYYHQFATPITKTNTQKFVLAFRNTVVRL